jgi:glycosyltransferase involved in cell wall biosynthesis
VKLCVIVPCYNEEENLLPFYNALKITVNKYDYKIIFINDGSTDNTLEVIKSIAGIDKNILYISLSRNFGHQNALKAGYDYADGDCVVCMDSDLQQPPSLIDGMIQKWKEGYEVVFTIRKDGNNVSFGKRMASKCFYKLLNFISKIKLTPNAADFRLIDRKVLKVIQSFNEENLFLRGLIAWAGFKQYGLEYTVDKRLHGESKYSFHKMFSLSLVGVTSFSISPLRLSSILGVVFSAFAFLYCFYALYIHLYTGRTVQGWTSLIVSFLFVTGLQFILIGIIGEYLGKGFIEAKKRPNYLISEDNLSQMHMEVVSGLIIDDNKTSILNEVSYNTKQDVSL